jgi:hypothetical protein
MDSKPGRFWTVFVIGTIGWLMMSIAILSNGDRLNKFDQRLIEMEKRIHDLEMQLMGQ